MNDELLLTGRTGISAICRGCDSTPDQVSVTMDAKASKSLSGYSYSGQQADQCKVELPNDVHPLPDDITAYVSLGLSRLHPLALFILTIPTGGLC